MSSISPFPYRAVYLSLVSTSPRSSEYLADMWELLERLRLSLYEEMSCATVSREMKISAHGRWGAML